jgi:hypothetical protein
VRVGENENERKGYKQNNVYINSKLHAYKVVAKLLHRHKDLLTKVKTPCLSQD